MSRSQEQEMSRLNTIIPLVVHPPVLVPFCPIAIIFVALLCLDTHVLVDSVPVCTHGLASCHILALARLFDQVNQHLVRVHDLSSDLLSEFELYFLPSRYHITRGYPKCHTSSILTPNGKDNVQRMAVRLVVLKLLVAWRDPLHELHRRFAGQKGFDIFSRNVKSWR
ncbi:hypothetical protein P4O66_015405 [Electrophorus voltai]|uniref:Prolactin n=1 Tax=Electrophorus voltai TaxID=2609070 RepID=A0AAD8Z0W3_9TELE|nr:hypothetical protein P4O66_015405 [Electrophorus voltai]